MLEIGGIKLDLVKKSSSSNQITASTLARKNKAVLGRKGLNLRALTDRGIKVTSKNKGSSYKLMLASSGLRDKEKIANLIMSFNDIDIKYSEDLEDNELIRKSKKPLWALAEVSNGVFKIERKF